MFGDPPQPTGPPTPRDLRETYLRHWCVCVSGAHPTHIQWVPIFPLREYSVSSSELTAPPGAKERMELHVHFPVHLHHVSTNVLIKHRVNLTFLSVVRLFYVKPCQGYEKWTTLRTQHNTIQYNTAHVGLLFLDVTYCFESCLYIVSC
jgi:hypothetical protein